MSVIEHKKNTARYIAFPMVDSTTPAQLATGASVSDTAYYKDGAGAWTTLDITDTVSEIASTGMYEIEMTEAEMNHDQVIIKFTAAGAADTAIVFDMRAHLAEGIGLGADGNALISTDAQDLSTTLDVRTKDFTSGAIDADAIATDAIGSAELATTAVNEIRDAITGGAYALDTDANGRMRIVDGTAAGEIDLTTGGVLVSTLATQAKADVNAEVDTALVDIHLDHLLAVDTGASLPGVTGALFQDIFEDNAGTWRYTTAALANAPGGGGGGDATAANQTTIIGHLTDIKGAGWTDPTHTLEQIVSDIGGLSLGTSPQKLQSTTIATLASQTSFTLTAGSADDDAYNYAVVIVTDAVTTTQKAVGRVADYVGSTKTVTLAHDPGIFTMATGDTIDILAHGDSVVSTVTVDDSRTWFARGGASGLVSDEILVLQPGTTATLACNFSRILNQGTSLSSVTSVSDEASQSPAITISNLTLSGDRMSAHFDVSNITDDLNYRLKVTVLTSDNQTLPVDCRLAGEETP